MAVLDPKADGLKYEMEEEAPQRAKIKVIGVGGGGSNAVAHMLNGGLDGVEFFVVNTDSQALGASPVPNKLAIGAKLTRGRGAGGDESVGRQAALDDTERIVEMLQGSDMVFVTAGLGSGTGTGATPVVCSLAKELNALTVAVVTKPFSFEGKRRMRQAEKGLEELAGSVDTVIAIPNERLLALAPKGTSLLEAFQLGNESLRQIVQDIVEIISTPGLVNRDFADIRSAMAGQGYAVMGTATAKGENAAMEAARQAIACPLLEDAGIRGASNVLLNITGSSRLKLHDVSEACALIRKGTENEDAQLNFGVVMNEAMEDAVKVTLIATGFPRPGEQPVAAPQTAFAQEPWLQPSETLAPPREEPVAAAPPEAEPVYEPAPAAAPPPPSAPLFDQEEDLDDLDTPAFLRQRRVLH